MGLGPLHYMVITFDGHRVMSEVTSELRAVRRGGLLRQIDLLFLTKSQEGLAESIEVSDLRGHEVEAHASEHRAGRELVQFPNQADQMIDQADKALREHGDRQAGGPCEHRPTSPSLTGEFQAVPLSVLAHETAGHTQRFQLLSKAPNVDPELVGLVHPRSPAQPHDLPGAQEAIGTADEDREERPLLSCELDLATGEREMPPPPIEHHAVYRHARGDVHDRQRGLPQRGSQGTDQGPGGERLGHPLVRSRLQIELSHLQARIDENERCLGSMTQLADDFTTPIGRRRRNSPHNQVEPPAFKHWEGTVRGGHDLDATPGQPEASFYHHSICFVRLDQEGLTTSANRTQLVGHQISAPIVVNLTDRLPGGRNRLDL